MEGEGGIGGKDEGEGKRSRESVKRERVRRQEWEVYRTQRRGTRVCFL